MTTEQQPQSVEVPLEPVLNHFRQRNADLEYQLAITHARVGQLEQENAALLKALQEKEQGDV